MASSLAHPRWSPWKLRILVVVVALGLFKPLLVASDHQKQVLVIFATRRDTELPRLGDRQFPQLIADGLKQPVDYYSEYLDLPRSADPEYLEKFRDFLRTKYSTQHFDA